MKKYRRLLRLLAVTFTASILLAGPVSVASGEQTGTFTGTWIASGRLEQFEFTKGREVYTFALSGHVNLEDTVGEVKDYWAECVGLSDSVAGSSVRCVWQSLKGDKVYSVLSGEPLEKGQQVTGEFVGGTGSLNGLMGDFGFTWFSTFTDVTQNTFSGHTKNIKGRYRIP